MKKISLEEQEKKQQESPDSQDDGSLEDKTPESPKKPKGKNKNYLTIAAISLAVILGAASGAVFARNRLSGKTQKQQATDTQAPSSKQDVKKGKTYGSEDTETFKDIAEGVMQKGGIDGEGSHHLVRPGGPGKNVYLTSSIIDLDLFVGHKVKVWGETFNAKKAGWLMDVGRVQPTELNAELPSE